jgi:hypothetical protein
MNMATASRRDVLASLGLLAGSALASGCGQPNFLEPVASGDEPNPDDSPPASRQCWTYTKLDAAAVAETAYRIYPDGGCMYAVVGSVISTLAEEVGEPFRSFPIAMMRYGDGGIGHWGSLCGIINGGAALIGLFQSEKAKEVRESQITELCVWYETSSLPKYEPAEPQWADEAKPSIAGSVLCHVSMSRWCEVSGCGVFSMDRKERCRRLATDGAVKVVDILNRRLSGESEFRKTTRQVRACTECHGPQEQADAMVQMNCATCHQFEDEHP